MDAVAQLNGALAGRYVIEREIGSGGMATVYLARDLKHDRKVALKLLNADLGAVVGAERFLSEIRVTANLQHPNLLPLFDSGSADGLLYYVMPYVEGETLRHRLGRERQLPVDDALHIATAVAGALDYAHQHGVIHRDLKPENILLQHGQPVVADFGIALAISNAGGQRVTQTGLSLGTPQYMSPEQATGDRVIDARSDIYSLAAVTYEMLTGEPPHAGSTAQAIIARLMTEEPRPITVLRRSVPEHVDEAVRRALEKLPADRFATAGQYAAALNGGPLPRATHSPTRRTQRLRSSRALLGALAAASLLALIFAALWARALSRPDPRLLQFVLDMPKDQQVVLANESSVALSPDGGTLAYVARVPESRAIRIFVRRLDSLQAREQSIGGMAPRFSADGRWLLFHDEANTIRRVPLGGGNSEVVASAPNWQGYDVSARGDVVFSNAGSVWFAGTNASPLRLTSPDSSQGELSHASPSFLDDNTVAYSIHRSEGASGGGVGVTTLKGGGRSVLPLRGDRTFGMLDDHLLIGTDQGTLLAYPFNLRRRQITGAPVTLLDSAVWIIFGGLQLSIAQDGTLAYLRGGSHKSLALVDRSGATLAEAPEHAEYREASLSPDGKRVAVGIQRITTGGRNVTASDVWTWDVEGKTLARFTSDGGARPRWTPDGKRIAYQRFTTPNHADVVWAPADGSAPPETVLRVPADQIIVQFSFARQGRELLVVVMDTSFVTSDIYSVDLGSRDRALRPLLTTRFEESSPAVSPDGRWLAYISDETGRNEVYVRPYASPAGRIRISSNGGNHPEWLASGSRIVYGDGGRRLVADIADGGGRIVAIQRDTLNWEGVRQAVDSKGERVLVTRDPPGWRVVVVKSWVQEARKKLRGR